MMMNKQIQTQTESEGIEVEEENEGQDSFGDKGGKVVGHHGRTVPGPNGSRKPSALPGYIHSKLDTINRHTENDQESEGNNGVPGSTSNHLQDYSFRILPCNRRFIVCPCINQRARAKMEKILQHWMFATLILASTLTVVYLSDIKQLAIDPSFDVYVHIVLTFVMALFAIELCMSCVATRHYVFSFFFWVDLIATIGIAVAIPWNDYDGTGCTGSSKAFEETSRAFRLIRQGSRALRTVRLLRFLQVMRFFRMFLKWLTASTRKQRVESSEEDSSRLGQYLSYVSSRRVVLVIIFISLVTSLTNEIPDEADYLRIRTDIVIWSLVHMNDDGTMQGLQDILQASCCPLVFLQLNETVLFQQAANIRCDNLLAFEDSLHSSDYAAIFDVRQISKSAAVANITFVSAVIFSIFTATVLFHLDMETYVSVPLRRITRTVGKIQTKLYSAVAHNSKIWETDELDQSLNKLFEYMEDQKGRAFRPLHKDTSWYADIRNTANWAARSFRHLFRGDSPGVPHSIDSEESKCADSLSSSGEYPTNLAPRKRHHHSRSLNGIRLQMMLGESSPADERNLYDVPEIESASDTVGDTADPLEKD